MGDGLVTLGGLRRMNITLASGATTVTVANANALTVGPNGTTNPTLKVNTNTSSAATGIEIVAAAAAAGINVRAISSGTDENLTINAKGSGTITLNPTATGGITATRLLTTTAGITSADNLTFSVAAKGPVLKQGANGRVGTFVANGSTPVTVSNTSVAVTDAIIISLNTVGGTVGVQPHVATITDSTGFTVVCTASDTSTYNYTIIKNAA